MIDRLQLPHGVSTILKSLLSFVVAKVLAPSVSTSLSVAFPFFLLLCSFGSPPLLRRWFVALPERGRSPFRTSPVFPDGLFFSLQPFFQLPVLSSGPVGLLSAFPTAGVFGVAARSVDGFVWGLSLSLLFYRALPLWIFPIYNSFFLTLLPRCLGLLFFREPVLEIPPGSSVAPLRSRRSGPWSHARIDPDFFACEESCRDLTIIARSFLRRSVRLRRVI